MSLPLHPETTPNPTKPILAEQAAKCHAIRSLKKILPTSPTVSDSWHAENSPTIATLEAIARRLGLAMMCASYISTRDNLMPPTASCLGY